MAVRRLGGHRIQPDEQQIEDRQRQSRYQRGHEHVAHGYGEQVGHDDEHDARWNEDAEGARGGNRAAGERVDRKSTRLNSSHSQQSRMPSSA